MKRFLAVLLVLAAACGGKDSTGPSMPAVAGVWQYSDNTSSAALGISCSSTGPVSVSQNGGNFTGSSTVHQICTDSFGNSSTADAVVPVTGGQINGSQISFQTDGCQYAGSLSGNPTNAMSGSETCTVAVSGTNYTFTGPWQASR